MRTLILTALLLFSSYIFAQTGSVGIGNTTPNANAILDVKSGTKGALLPRMDSVARKAIPNVKGMVVYDSTYNSYYYNNGAVWAPMSGNAVAQAIVKGNNVGDMLYWNGTAWTIVPAGKGGQYLQFDSTQKPLWTGEFYPSVTTLPVTAITDSSANLNLKLINPGLVAGSDFADFQMGVYISTSPNPNSSDDMAGIYDTTTTPGNYSYNIGGPASYGSRLLVNTTYYVRAYASNDAGTVYGTQLSFTTLNGPVSIPVVTSGYESSLTNTTATISYNYIDNNGGGAITAAGIEYEASSGGTTFKTNDISSLSGAYFTSNLTGLLPNTTYYFVSYATNSAGTGYGASGGSFTTSP